MTLKDLHNDKSSGFKIPSNYFDGMENQMLDLAKLMNQVKDSGLRVSEAYFDNFEVEIPKVEESKVIQLSNRKVIISVLSIAASILILMNLSIFNSKSISFNDLDTDILEYYVLNQEDNISLESFDTDFEALTEDILEEAVNDQTLENYIYNSTDIEEFIQE